MRVLDGISSVKIIDQHFQNDAVRADENCNAWTMLILIAGDFDADRTSVG